MRNGPVVLQLLCKNGCSCLRCRRKFQLSRIVGTFRRVHIIEVSTLRLLTRPHSTVLNNGPPQFAFCSIQPTQVLRANITLGDEICKQLHVPYTVQGRGLLFATLPWQQDTLLNHWHTYVTREQAYSTRIRPAWVHTHCMHCPHHITNE